MRNLRPGILFLALSPLLACQQLVGWPDGDVTAPRVTATSPADGEIDVAANSSIFATFDEHMDPRTLSSASFLVYNDVVITGDVTQFGDITTVFVPSDVLEPNEEYTATITTEASDPSGNRLAQEYSWTFTTSGLDSGLPAPFVILTDPEDLEPNVSVDTTVRAMFSEVMDEATINGANFEVTGPGPTPVTGAVAYNPLNNTGTFTPDDQLLTDTTYTATVRADAEDLDGTPMDRDYVWTFSTEAIPFLAPPIDLGILSSFVAVAGVAITNSGPTYLNGDVGLSPGVATQCTACTPPDMYITGELHIADSIAAQAKADLTDALIEAQALPPATAAPFLISADLHGQILAPGVYTSPSTMELSPNGLLTLDAQGDPNAWWVFQVGSALTVHPGARVVLINGGRPANVFWAIGSSSTILANAAFQGTVLAQASNSVGTNASVVGRLLCTEGEITLLSNSITLPLP